MEFVAKRKKLKVSIDGVSYEMRCPTIGERDNFTEKLKDEKPEGVIKAYAEWYEGLGLPKSALYSLDADDFFELIEFISTPKKKQMI